MKLLYQEGDVICVPLRDRGFALGVIARRPKNGKVLLGYFYAARLASCPDRKRLPALRPQAATRVLRFGDLNLLNGKWTVLGPLPGWNKGAWPMPQFVRKDEISRRATLVSYADDDPNRMLGEQRCDFNIEGYERDAMLGAGAVEIVLTRIASTEASSEG